MKKIEDDLKCKEHNLKHAEVVFQKEKDEALKALNDIETMEEELRIEEENLMSEKKIFSQREENLAHKAHNLKIKEENLSEKEKQLNNRESELKLKHEELNVETEELNNMRPLKDLKRIKVQITRNENSNNNLQPQLQKRLGPLP